MRFPLPVAVVAILLILGLVQPVDARGGKGGGGGGGHARGGQQVHGGSPAEKVHGGSPAGAKQHDQPANGKAAHETPARDKAAKDKDKDKTAKSKKSDENSSDQDEGADGGSPNKKEKQLANFQRQRDKKISQAEHLRQIAERNGNANLAANADRMEAQARDEYAKKVSHLEKFGVTDPELNPDGVDPTNPLVPDTGPLSDPLSTLRGLLPFGR